MRNKTTTRATGAVDNYGFGNTTTLFYQGNVKQKNSIGIWKSRWITVRPSGLATYIHANSELPIATLPSSTVVSCQCKAKAVTLTLVEAPLPTLLDTVATIFRRFKMESENDAQRLADAISSIKSLKKKSDTLAVRRTDVYEWQDEFNVWRSFDKKLVSNRSRVEFPKSATTKFYVLDFKNMVLKNPVTKRKYQLRIEDGDTTSSESSSQDDDDDKRPEASLKKVVEISNYCTSTKQSFVDPDFPPTSVSLYKSVNSAKHASSAWVCGQCNSNNAKGSHVCWSCQAHRIVVVDWLRPVQSKASSTSTTTPWRIFDAESGPAPSDIHQGALGNCWFLSALSVLAERPDILRKCYSTATFNPAGVYLLNLCRDGIWEKIMVDDFLPCANVSGRLAYAQTVKKQLWVPLIEKALAKLYGSYEAIAAGQIYDGMSILTGLPVQKIDLRNKKKLTQRSHRVDSASAMGMMGYDDLELDDDILWIRLLSYREAGYLMGASCGIYDDDDNGDIHATMGLQRFHAYSVLDVRSVGPHRLLQLRNPWGSGAKGRWNGDWSENSDRWTPDLRLLLRKDGDEAAGVFWMSYEHVRKFFGRIDICKMRPHWYESERITGNFLTSLEESVKVFHIRSKSSSSQVELTLQQPSQRGSMKDVPLVDMGLVLLKQNSRTGCYELVADSKRVPSLFVSIESFIEAGEHYVAVPMGFNKIATNSRALRYTFVVHSSKKEVSVTSEVTSQAILATALALRARKHGERKEIFKNQILYTQSHDAGAVILVENRHAEHYFQVEMDNSDSFNVGSSRGRELKSLDSVPPMSFQIVQVLSQVADSGYSWSSKLRYNGSRKGETHNPEILAPGLHCPQRFTSAF